jgi:hypothetical protein
MTNYENVKVEGHSIKEEDSKRVLGVISIGRFDHFARIESNEVYGFSMKRHAVLDGVETWTLDEPGAEQRITVQPISGYDAGGRFIVNVQREAPYEGDLRLLFEKLQKRVDSAENRECPHLGDETVKPELVEYLCRLFE